MLKKGGAGIIIGIIIGIFVVGSGATYFVIKSFGDSNQKIVDIECEDVFNEGENYDNSELWIYTQDNSLEESSESINEIFPIKTIDKIGYYEETDVAGTFIIGSDFK